MKKIRLMGMDGDEGAAVAVAEATRTIEQATEASGSFTAEEKERLMKYAEAIDWKLWEILKLMRAQAEEK